MARCADQPDPQEALAAEAARAALCLLLMNKAEHQIASFGDAYKQVGINYSLEACDLAAKITGADPFFAKMLNHKFRTDAAEMMFERSLKEVA